MDLSDILSAQREVVAVASVLTSADLRETQKGQSVTKQRGRLAVGCSSRPSPFPVDAKMTIETTTGTVSDLNKVKNSIIGNPLAEDGIVRDEGELA
jgi:hypothetical protein